MIGKKDEVLVQREVVTNIEEDINEVINAEIEAAVKAKADELSKKYYRNITVKFGAKINKLVPRRVGRVAYSSSLLNCQGAKAPSLVRIQYPSPHNIRG